MHNPEKVEVRRERRYAEQQAAYDAHVARQVESVKKFANEIVECTNKTKAYDLVNRIRVEKLEFVVPCCADHVPEESECYAMYSDSGNLAVHNMVEAFKATGLTLDPFKGSEGWALLVIGLVKNSL